MLSFILRLPRYLPHITLSNFLWFLVVLNIVLFIYIQASNRRSQQKTSKITRPRGHESLMGHWSGGMDAFFARKRVIEIGYRVLNPFLSRLGGYAAVGSTEED